MVITKTVKNVGIFDMAKQKEKIIPIEPKKLFWTMKQHVFHYLETHPLIRNPKELCFALPDYKTVTLYNYYKEWKNKKEYAISAFVSDIWVLLYLLGHKFTPTKQSSTIM